MSDQAADCIFCRIAAGEIPADTVAEDADFVAFRDLHPLAPVHVLVVPKQHVASLNDITEFGPGVDARLLRFIADTASRQGVAESGYRVVSNIGPHAGQEVMHMHWHIIGGRGLGEMA
jgi:histidine triad (HIT) family protein